MPNEFPVNTVVVIGIAAIVLNAVQNGASFAGQRGPVGRGRLATEGPGERSGREPGRRFADAAAEVERGGMQG